MNMKILVALTVIFTIHGIAAFNQPNACAQQPDTQSVENEYQVGAVIFHQKAAEYRALTYQAFNLAQLRLDMDKKLSKKLPKSERKKPRAIIIDADETVLDNTPYFAKLIKTGAPFDINTFFEWKKTASANAVPGSVEFLKYAKSKNVEIFYVSNVPNSFKEATVKGLSALDFPDAREENVMLITDSGSKEPRRKKVAETHRIVMLIGDSLNDLSVAFEGKSVEDRFAEVEKVKEMWGTRFIVIPNIIYGAWEAAVYEGKRLSEIEKKRKRIDSLEDY